MKLVHTILACKSGDLVYISTPEEATALATMLLRLGTSEQAVDYPNDSNTPMPRYVMNTNFIVATFVSINSLCTQSVQQGKCVQKT